MPKLATELEALLARQGLDVVHLLEARPVFDTEGKPINDTKAVSAQRQAGDSLGRCVTRQNTERAILMDTCVFIRTIPPALNWLAAVSILLLIAKIFVLNSIPEPVPGLYHLGLIFEGVLASILASYAFYLIVVHYKETKDRRVIYPNVLKWAQGVVGDCQSQVSEFSKYANRPIALRSLTKQDVESVFKKINPMSKAPLVFSIGQHANWIQYFEHYRVRTNGTISKIMAQLVYLEAPLVAYLTKVDDCSHFNSIRFSLGQRLGNKNLHAFASAFFSYCAACRELDDYLAHHAHGANTV